MTVAEGSKSRIDAELRFARINFAASAIPIIEFLNAILLIVAVKLTAGSGSTYSYEAGKVFHERNKYRTLTHMSSASPFVTSHRW
ncbi:hypothetical protein AGR13a_Lc30099 [Agrobacterium genomosp. 13 str. CFBP 6927]|uniref:Uncharacterized protein n=1 Tax=Agrobacterium genomosp. 13 str. CFBP 6927 TaxID=1183428 RepID=A0ABP2BQF3_9HYPH|nr:hypothetical protein AGR13a_Lc30099 [Agrobacterium genomosp. 13 str. CFBP 6927]